MKSVVLESVTNLLNIRHPISPSPIFGRYPLWNSVYGSKRPTDWILFYVLTLKEISPWFGSHTKMLESVLLTIGCEKQWRKSRLHKECHYFTNLILYKFLQHVSIHASFEVLWTVCFCFHVATEIISL